MMVGIIGKPNTGKSTFFNAATLLNVPMASYPFTTISPNFGVGYLRVRCVHNVLQVSDAPVNSLCVNGWRLIPIKLVDVAGLVPGASTGRGLGNKFLDDIRQADALIHVVDASGSSDEEGRICPPGSRDPFEDIEFVEREFDLWLKQIVSKDFARIARASEGGSGRLSTMLAERLSGLGITEKQIISTMQQAGVKEEKPSFWTKEELLAFCTALRLLSKPTLVAANKSDLPSSATNIERLKQTGRLTVPCAAEGELLLRRASEQGLIDYTPGDGDFRAVRSDGLTSAQLGALNLVRDRVLIRWGTTGVQQAINSAYLGLMGAVVVYPVEDEHKLSDKKGNVLPDAYVMRKSSTARDLAYAIHSDLGDSFLYAVDARKGTRLGADYVLKDSDVIKIVATAKRG